MAGKALSRSERIERGAARYQAKHPGATRAEARTAAVKAADQYDKRIASHLAKHPNASAAEAKRAARGHGSTGEHGVTVTPLGNNQYAVSFRDPAKAEQAMRAAAKLEGRVTVTAIGKDGKPVELFQNKGHSRGFSSGEAMQAAAKKAGGWDKFIERALDNPSGPTQTDAGVIDADDYDEYDEDELEEQEEEVLAGIREYQLIVQ